MSATQTLFSRAAGRKLVRRAWLAGILLALAGGLLPGSTARAQSTVDASFNEAWGANIGWTNWLPSAANGVVIGEYVCAGYLYSANVGWISVGSGAPANHVYYANQSATDYGVNFLPTGGGYAALRGYAYAANVGWIAFEAQGNPRVFLPTGVFSGYAYSANCGWLNLGDLSYHLKTDRIAPGVDSDGDGIADAYEYQYFGNLTTANATSSYLHDGATDLQRYLAGVSPTDPNAFPRITAFSLAGTNTVNLSFTSSPARLYTLETTTDLVNGAWSDSGLGTFVPGGTTTTLTLSQTASSRRFYRVRAQRPLQ